MKGSVKVFNVMTIIFVVVFIAWITELNYSDLSFKENRNAYFGMSSAGLMIFAMQKIKRSLLNSKQKEKDSSRN